MLYAMWVADVELGKWQEYLELTEQLYPITVKCGARTVGIWKEMVGDWQKLYTIQAYKDLADYEEVRGRMAADPVCRDVLVKMEGVRRVTVKLMTSVPFVPEA